MTDLVNGFTKELMIILIDKGLLAIMVLIVGYYFNKLLQKKKARDSMLEAIVEQRISAYKSLWETTQVVKFARREEILLDEKQELAEKLSQWYYKDGAAMFLSFKASKLYGEAREVLREDSTASFKEIQQTFSSLRTQLKNDLKIYSEGEDKKQTIDPNKIFKSGVNS